MHRALKGVLWTIAASAGLQLGARALRRRWPAPLPASMGWLKAMPTGVPAREIARNLDLERGLHVLLLGAGPEALVEELAEGVGATGRLVAVDPRLEVLERLGQAAAGLTNFAIQAAEPCEVPCPDGSFDRVLMAPGLACTSDPGGLFRECHRVLRPHGRLVVTEVALDVEFVSERRALDMALAAGFVLRGRRGGAWRYLLVFERAAAPSHLHAPHREHRIETYG